MEKIKPGKYVELVYDLYEVNPDGEKLVHQVDPQDPEKIIFGVTQGVIIPLERAIDGLEEGSPYDVKASAEEAFGPYDPDQVVELDKNIFEVDGKFDSEAIKPGEVIPMMTADGFRISGLVKNVGPEKVTMDFNHPLAGKEVRFKGKILKVRDATPEELTPDTGCGCGCHDHGCDDGCDCDGHQHGHCCGHEEA